VNLRNARVPKTDILMIALKELNIYSVIPTYPTDGNDFMIDHEKTYSGLIEQDGVAVTF
jgi:hypothetical protein